MHELAQRVTFRMLQKPTHPDEKGFTVRTAEVVFPIIRKIVARLITLVGKIIDDIGGCTR
ncbi:unnamed protein product [Clonostachys rosea f. rosea IK726]|uniref:Uncharacterized protein n=1 Tax=Clonostachys rosea f. rosea IK726 TaxID=1349383 RepID=A0ACA9UFT6_BIOOC|nr:unnamed protein product [Clonostachys rosea f. rosea IK726]